MANKTAKEILENCYSLRFHTEASRQLYEATLEIIGDDWRAPLSPLNKVYQTKREGVNFEKAKQRAKARAFYGITESEEEGTK